MAQETLILTATTAVFQNQESFHAFSNFSVLPAAITPPVPNDPSDVKGE